MVGFFGNINTILTITGIISKKVYNLNLTIHEEIIIINKLVPNYFQKL